jgi:hypothetical protein
MAPVCQFQRKCHKRIRNVLCSSCQDNPAILEMCHSDHRHDTVLLGHSRSSDGLPLLLLVVWWMPVCREGISRAALQPFCSKMWAPWRLLHRLRWHKPVALRLRGHFQAQQASTAASLTRGAHAALGAVHG